MAIFSIRNFVKKQMMKTSDQGIVNMPSDMKLDFGEAVITKTLLDAGIDPKMIKNDKQLETILDSIDKMMRDAAKPVDKGIKSTQSAKIFNLQGEELDPSKPIIGGTQQGKKINREFFERDAAAKEVQQRIDSGVAATVEKMLAMKPIDAMKEANRVIKREGPYKNLTQQDAKKILQDTEDHIFERNIKPRETDMNFDEGATDEVTKAYNDAVKKGKFKGTEEDFRNKIDDMMDEDFAVGGRVGLKKGMDRRTFMKIMGGLTTIPIFGKFFKGAEVAAPVTQKVMENFSSRASEAPTYFFDLMTKIKVFGKKSKVGPSDRVDEYSYTGKNGDEYTLTEDITTGDAQITKDKIGGRSYEEGSYDVIEDRTVMEYKAPKQDVDVETQKTTNEAAEYEEYKVDFDQDGTEAGADAIDEMIQKEIIEEAAEEAPSIKKASGGIARMLGE